MKFLIFFIFAISTALGQNYTCPNDFSLFQNVCFYVGNNGKVITWADARLHCQSLGKGIDLASIHNAFEQAYIASQSHAKDTWIGLYNEAGDWSWVDGSLLDYTDWVKNEPSGDDPCTRLDQSKNLLWNNNNCDGVYGLWPFDTSITQYACRTAATSS
uniref:C-type lectin domain-containing protein n=1 Tax=Acrobeloides nanus TaxID=290746 RepID=A0A914CI58_9BILA